MKVYIIYDMQTDGVIGHITARNVDQAEITAADVFNRESDQIYALQEGE